jgi:hypothetical protein
MRGALEGLRREERGTEKSDALSFFFPQKVMHSIDRKSKKTFFFFPSILQPREEKNKPCSLPRARERRSLTLLLLAAAAAAEDADAAPSAPPLLRPRLLPRRRRKRRKSRLPLPLLL